MSAITPRICFCIICRKETNQLGIKTHFLRAHSDSTLWDNTTKQKNNLKQLNIEKYNINPKLCNCCSKPLSYEQRTNSFCSSSCSAQTNNSGRVMASATKEKLKQHFKRKFKHRPEIVGEYSKLWYAKCLHCGIQFYSAKRSFVCKEHQHLKYNHNRHLYSFTFNVHHYPDLFDLEVLKQLGWYSPGGKKAISNPNGLSRDHKVSVSSARINNYDPYYITHPCNCALITQKENSAKNSKSSISYEELVRLVDEYDSNRGGI